MKNITIIALIICTPLVFWGWAYEVSYFYTLGLDVTKTLNLFHYVYSSFIRLLSTLMVIIILTAIAKLFSKNIDRNDWVEVKTLWSETGFIRAINDARFTLIFTLIIWIIVLVPQKISILNWLVNPFADTFMLLIYFNILMFSASLYLSPSHSGFAIVLMLVLSIGLCFSFGGIYRARISMESKGLNIRDDYLVTITKENGKYIALAKPINIPLPTYLKHILIFLDNPNPPPQSK